MLRDRAYVRMEQNRFIPEDKGRIVTAFLTSFFKRYVEYDFTADLEEKLDEVSAGELAWKESAARFLDGFSAAIDETKELKFADVIDALDEILGPHMFPEREDGADPRACPVLRQRPAEFEARALRRLHRLFELSRVPLHAPTGPRRRTGTPSRALLGNDPKTGQAVDVKSGRFGPYIQCEAVNGEKPPRAGIPKGWAADTIDLEKALKLLALPREVGIHPETGHPIVAGFGRFGPYVKHDKQYASLETPEDVFTVGINRAVTLIAERKAKARPDARGGPRRSRNWARIRERRADQGYEGPLWPLCQRRQGQRDAARRSRSDGGDAGRGGGADRRARRQGPGKEEGPRKKAGTGCKEGAFGKK